jgi:hypothetical protein
MMLSFFKDKAQHRGKKIIPQISFRVDLGTAP